MQFTQLIYFIEVERCGSIREAAKKMNVAPSAISRQIANLENDINMPLFERRPRGMILTAAGEIYAKYAQRLVAEKDKIFTVEGALNELLNKAVVEFRLINPNITFSITITGSEEVLAGIRSVDADIGLTYYANPDAGVKFYTSMKAPLCAVMAPDYPLADSADLRLRDIVNHPFAIPVKSFGIRGLLDSCCKAEGITITPALETNSIEALRGFARNGGGVSSINQSSVFRDILEGRLVAIPFSDHVLNHAFINICILQDRSLPLTTSSFLEFLQLKMQQFEERLNSLPN
jgi:DNA-binding transcriptional LysR family regulator